MGSYIEKNLQMFTDFQTKLAEQTGNTDAWAKTMQMPQSMLPAGYAAQIQKMQEQMRQHTSPQEQQTGNDQQKGSTKVGDYIDFEEVKE